MSAAPARQRVIGLWRQARWRPGAQLAAAVAVAWGVSAALRLPESFWSVMSVLIVMRPSAGSTLGAGWDRVRGTAAGALCGMAGVYLQHHGAHGVGTTLALVMLLAFGGAAVPGLRSAPVAALIVLSAGGIPGHSALEVALLRMAQIGIGVAVALAISTLASEYHAGPRFDAGCAALLRGIARRMAALGAGEPVARSGAAQAERAGDAVRASLARLAVLAGSADLEARWWRRGAPTGDAGAFRSKARIAARIFQDATVLGRVFGQAQGTAADPSWREAAQTAGAALADMADALEGKRPPPDLGALGRWASAAREEGAAKAMLAAPLGLLLADLQQLRRLAAPALSGKA